MKRRSSPTIEKLGGQVTVDAESPTRPVIAIDLAETKVADADLEQLKAFPRLETLNLDHTQITDAGLEHLKELYPAASPGPVGDQGHRRRTGPPRRA